MKTKELRVAVRIPFRLAEQLRRRYAIVDAGVLREAAAKIDGAVGTIPGTMTGTQGKRADGHSV